MTSIVRVMAVAIAMLCAPAVDAAVKSKATHTTYQVRRASTNVPPAPTSEEECIRRAHEAADTEGETRESGANDFQCHKVLHILTTFGPNPPCPSVPAPEGRVVVCPSGTTGAYTQTLSYSAAPYPTCAVAGEWLPTEPPASCVPIDSDGDGVPDSTDQCPTVRSVTADGCPASPPVATWVHCADQDQRCEFSGTRTVRYGVDTRWVEREFADGVICNSATMGTNPAPGTLKTCELQEDGAPQPEPEPEPEPAPAGTVTLSWTPPTANVDGSALTNLAGYRISYGLTAAALAHTVQVANPGVSSYALANLAPGTWYFAVRAYSSAGGQSDPSNIVSKVVQ